MSPKKIDQLISALAGALRDHDAGNGPMPREETADALAMAEAAGAEAKEDIEEVYRRGEAQGRADHAALTAAEVGHLRLRLAAAERVRRGARCLRERCRRLSAALRKAQEVASHADAQAYAREAMAELAVSKLRELGVNVSMLSLWDELNGVHPPPRLQDDITSKYVAFCKEMGCLCSRLTEEELYYIEHQDSDEAFLAEVAKIHATFALWLKRGQHGGRD